MVYKISWELNEAIHRTLRLSDETMTRQEKFNNAIYYFTFLPQGHYHVIIFNGSTLKFKLHACNLKHGWSSRA